MSNLTINVTGPTGCQTIGEFWAVSQAAPMRRVQRQGRHDVDGLLHRRPAVRQRRFHRRLRISGGAINGSQQQFLVRNSNIGGWSNGVWNQVFSGVVGRAAADVLDTPATRRRTRPWPPTRSRREKPYLYIDAAGSVQRLRPALRADSARHDLGSGPTAGTSLPIERFFLAKPATRRRPSTRRCTAGRT